MDISSKIAQGLLSIGDLGYRQQGLSGPVSGGVSKAAGAG